MNTSREMSLKSAIFLDDTPLTDAQVGYFKAMAQSEAHERILSLFLRMAKEKGINRAFLARKLRKKPEQITRWLSAPGNWTLDTYSILAAALGHKASLDTQSLDSLRNTNECHPHATAATGLWVSGQNIVITNAYVKDVSANSSGETVRIERSMSDGLTIQ